MAEDLSHKEILLILMEKVDNLSDSAVKSTVSLEGIEKHLGQLNSKVATHEKRLNEHTNFITKVTAYATVGATAITFALNKII